MYINAIIAEDLLDAVTLKILQHETNQDNTLAALKSDNLNGVLLNQKEVGLFRGVFKELSIFRSFVLQGKHIVIPEAQHGRGIKASQLQNSTSELEYGFQK